jgi:antitoxin ParD1/3/4
MIVSLTPELEQLVEEKVSSGLYNSPSEVIQEALRLLRERDELKEMRRAELRREIARGLEAAERGELISGDEVFKELRERTAKAAKRNK